MSGTTATLRRVPSGEIAEELRAAGVAGAGGAGFPSYVKWDDVGDASYLLVNHQESEPNFYADKWLGRERSEELAALFDYLLDECFDAIVVGAKEKDRLPWTEPLEDATDATVYGPGDLPLDPAAESGVVFAYTPDVYTYSEERVLLQVAAGVTIGTDLPTDHGWLVHNTETLWNVYRALADDAPVTRKYVHVDGNTTWHRCLDVPVGTPAGDLLAAARTDPAELPPDALLAEGGIGWCSEIPESIDEFGVRRRTNGLLVLDRQEAERATDEDGRIDLLAEYDRTHRTHEAEPMWLEPGVVRLPLRPNDAHAGVVAPAEPVVAVGDSVSAGDVVASASPDAVSIPQHASIDGRVTAVTDTHVVVERT